MNRSKSIRILAVALLVVAAEDTDEFNSKKPPASATASILIDLLLFIFSSYVYTITD